jgi:hypothetical protein
MNRGLKFDEGKQKWDSLPLEILEPLADLMEAGRKKYGKFNCLNPFENSDERFWNSRMRHMASCQHNPLATDPETGCYHEAAIAFASLMRLHHAKFEEEDNVNAELNQAARELAAVMRGAEHGEEAA